MTDVEKDTGAGDLAGRPRDKRVGELLIEEGLINEDQLRLALEHQVNKGGKLFEILIAQKVLTKEALHSFLSKQSGVPSIDLRNYEIPRELVSIIPEDIVRMHVVLPIDKLGKLLTVGMACPLDVVAIQDLERITGLKVKAMLCKLDDIHARIERYYPVKQAAPPPPPAPPKPPVPPAPASRLSGPRRIPPRHDAVDLIEKADQIPMVAGVVQPLIRQEEAKASIHDLALAAAGEPALCARLMSVANCSAYGMPGSVTSVHLAATLLGTAGVRSVALGLNAPPPAECPSFNVKSFLLRSLFCATAAMAAAQKSSRIHPTDAYTTGLLHDCGRLALAHLLPADYAKVECGLSVYDLMDSELGEFGFTHAEAGYRLANAWGLPQPIAGAIRTHHDVDALKLDPLAATVALMAMLAENFERSAPVRVEGLNKAHGLLAQSGLDAEAVVAIYDATSAAIKSSPKRKA